VRNSQIQQGVVRGGLRVGEVRGHLEHRERAYPAPYRCRTPWRKPPKLGGVTSRGRHVKVVTDRCCRDAQNQLLVAVLRYDPASQPER
jgi:hypothetical protein